MAYKEVLRVDIAEVIRRWQAGSSRRQIASGAGLSKDTVGKYIAAAEALGVSVDGPAPSEEQFSRLAAIGQPGPRASRHSQRGPAGPWATRSTVAHRRPHAADSHPRVAGGAWLPGVVLPPYSASWPAATGAGGAMPRPCGWRTPRLGRWRRWTSAVSV